MVQTGTECRGAGGHEDDAPGDMSRTFEVQMVHAHRVVAAMITMAAVERVVAGEGWFIGVEEIAEQGTGCRMGFARRGGRCGKASRGSPTVEGIGGHNERI